MRNMTAAIKRYFRRSKRNPPSPSANIGTHSGAQQHAEPEPPQVVPADDSQVLACQEEPDPDPASAAADVDAARRAFDAIKPVSSTGQVAVKLVAQADTRVINAQSLSDTYLKPLKVFNTAVTGFAELIITQANIDKAVLALVEKLGYVYTFLLEKDAIENMKSMKENLGKIARVISDCAGFIKNYSNTTNFWKRLGKNVVSETQTAIDDYSQVLDGLMQQYRDHTIRDIRIYVHRVLDELNLEGMSYVGGASLNTMKKCLDDTRMEVLQDIIDWVNDDDPDSPRILWLHGQAGRGKSAIAHTIAAWTKDVGRLGSCFCFARDKRAERREEKMLSTIARDLAGWDLTFRQALLRVLEEDHTLKTTPDMLQQWKKLILEPMSEAANAIVGNVAVVIDALDECETVSSRCPILSLLASNEAANLPPNFRILACEGNLFG
ncbi:hypothetical protein EDD15DRAFT_1355786 [Pisolithus albus]|nr:hypothetical protein EDD15DRAFT_1355786 [Pisolithus albus]